MPPPQLNITLLQVERGMAQRYLHKLKGLIIEALEDDSKVTSACALAESLPDEVTSFKSCHTKIMALPSSADGQDELWKQYDEFLEEVTHIKAQLSLPPFKQPVTSQAEGSSTMLDEGFIGTRITNQSNSCTRLPKLDLPIFCGNLSEWTPYFDMFCSSIDQKEDLQKVHKFQYLKSTLRGDPLILIKNLPLTDANYDIAIQLLRDRFENRRLISTHHLEAILNLPTLTSTSLEAISSFISKINEHAEALRAQGHPVDSWSPIFAVILCKKLDRATRSRFERRLNRDNLPDMNALLAFLRELLSSQQWETLATRTPSDSKPEKLSRSPKPPRAGTRFKSYATHALVATSPPSFTPCKLCRGSHPLYRCTTFVNYSPEERFKFIKQHQCCINCLNPSHIARMCPSQRTCKRCQGKHHTLLHFESQSRSADSAAEFRNNASTSSTTTPSTSTVDKETTTCLARAPCTQATVLLATALVHIEDSFGKRHQVRVLLDSGSQRSFITESCVQRLKLKRRRINTSILAMGETKLLSENGVTTCSIHPRDRSNPTITLSPVIVDKISGHLPNTPLPVFPLTHVQHRTLADPTFCVPSQVDLLLGAEVWPQVLKRGRVSSPGLPMAMETVFGWVLMGKVNVPAPPLINTLHATVEPANDLVSLDTTLQKFWKIEEPIVTSEIRSPEDTTCEEIYCRTTSRADTGRYTVNLPFRSYPPTLGNSYHIALQCLKSLQRRLNVNPVLKEEYKAFMQDYLEEGHMSLVDHADMTRPAYYIPHHCVVKPDATTTKLRVVFNASKCTNQNVSLNDVLYPGPVLQQDIIVILLRWRFYPVVLTADVRKMYRQIEINKEHRPFQRILWSFDFSDVPQVYNLNTVTYGVSSAPYLALRTVKRLAEDERVLYPKAARVLSEDTYVDDIITGCSTVPEAVQLQIDLTNLLASGGFRLHKWSSNDPRVLHNVPDSEKQIHNTDFDLDRDQTVKILGLRWSPVEDCFSFKAHMEPRGCTKRIILSEISRIFDPLGYMSPLTLYVKQMIQTLWTYALDWDAEPPSDIRDRWSQFSAELHFLETIRIPRCISIGNTIELIGFADASQVGYAGVIYCRCPKTRSVKLLCSKGRVTPLKRITLPRLELCAALLLSRLLKSIIQTIPIKIDRVTAFSDSTVTLAWIKGSPHRWKTFVSNRVAEIQTNVAPDVWHYVKSAENAADIASRGLAPAELAVCEMWWTGPQWLQQPYAEWPQSAQPPDLERSEDEEYTSEEAQTTLVTILDDSVNLLDTYSSLSKLQRVTAYIYRYYNSSRTKTRPTNLFLSPAELETALQVWIKIEQRRYFDNEIIAIRANRPCTRWLKKLNPFLDDKDLLRVGGRLLHAPVSFDKKHPVLLPSSSTLTGLMIDYYHRLYLHPGPLALQAIMSAKYWIVSARNVIRHRLSRCHACFKTHPRSNAPLMADLPMHRVSQLKPFLATGVDYGGPFLITPVRGRGAKHHKSYLCLFVCFATKAIHLELALDLSTDSFLAAFRRFIARRGRCLDLYSDQGTNFVGADKQLTQLFAILKSANFNKEMSSHLLQDGVKWHFNPPKAPHFGGLWEAGIKSVKKHLARTIGEQILSYEEFNTLLTQVEAILNSRPLCPLSTDPNDMSALTPGHFLVTEPTVTLPELDHTTVPTDRLSRWQLIEQLHQTFWKRWKNEYLNTLQQRSKWYKEIASIPLNTVVLVQDDKLPPSAWQLGRVVSLHPGSDDVIRVATIRTANGHLVRPVVKLCPLPRENQA